MTGELSIFRFEGVDLYAVSIEGEPWFKVADVCRILDIGNPSMAAARLDDDEVTLISVEGRPKTNFVSEAGLFALILGSRKPEARAFKRWVTHEVLPSIRRTGAYVAPQTPAQRMAAAVLEAQRIIEARDAQVAELTPRAEAWDELASAEGDFSVADTAKMLARAGVETGPQRLFEQLERLRWIFRGRDGKWRAYASAVSEGYLTERPQSHEHPRTRERVIDVPQVRVTMRGADRLRVRLGRLRLVEVAS